MTATRIRSHWQSAALVVLFLATATWKIAQYESLPQYDAGSDRLLFWTESAFHYRYAKIAAAGADIPAHDAAAQMPEGLDVSRHITVFMEVVAGRTYFWTTRWGLLELPFHVFLIRFICWTSTLGIVALFFTARAVWNDRTVALVVAALYAVSPLSFNRTLGNYIREDFALPLLFLFCAFFFRSIREPSARRRMACAILAGGCAGAALSAWHVSRFFFLVLTPIPIILALSGSDTKVLRNSVLGWVGGSLLASAIVPVLLEKRFFLSAPMLVLYVEAIVLIAAAHWRWSGRRIAGTILAGGALAIAVFGILSDREEYGHVYSLILAKIRYLGSKPVDPLLLPFEARSLWLAPFNSPTAYYAAFQGGLFGPLALGALAAGFRARARLDGAAWCAVYALLAFGALFLMIQRMSSTLVFFLALSVGTYFLAAPRKRTTLLVAATVVWLFMGWQAWDGSGSLTDRVARSLFSPKVKGTVRNDGNPRRLVEWIRFSTEPSASFLTWYRTGPLVLTDAERPIIVHPKFEASRVRRKYRRWLEGIYGSEEELAEVCEEFGARYVVFEADLTLDHTLESERYVAGLRELPTSSAAALLHFFPERLAWFTLVYQDSFYRVYRYDRRGTERAPSPPLPREEIWEAFRPAAGEEHLSAGLADTIRNVVESRAFLAARGRLALAEGDLAVAAKCANQILHRSPDAEEAILLKSGVLARTNVPAEALALIEWGLGKRPWSAELWLAKSDLLLAAGRANAAARGYREVLERNPSHGRALAALRGLERTE